jgi:hypothetical protein
MAIPRGEAGKRRQRRRSARELDLNRQPSTVRAFLPPKHIRREKEQEEVVHEPIDKEVPRVCEERIEVEERDDRRREREQRDHDERDADLDPGLPAQGKKRQQSCAPVHRCQQLGARLWLDGPDEEVVRPA